MNYTNLEKKAIMQELRKKGVSEDIINKLQDEDTTKTPIQTATEEFEATRTEIVELLLWSINNLTCDASKIKNAPEYFAVVGTSQCQIAYCNGILDGHKMAAEILRDLLVSKDNNPSIVVKFLEDTLHQIKEVKTSFSTELQSGED